ncbi:MAG: hypothetical protein ABIE68_02995 [bacterium]
MTEEKPQVPGKDKDIEENKTYAAISYLWIISIVVLLTKGDSKFAKFHAKQGTALFILSAFTVWIPIFGWILGFVFMILMLIGLVNAIGGKWWKLPLIGDWLKDLDI